MKKQQDKYLSRIEIIKKYPDLKFGDNVKIHRNNVKIGRNVRLGNNVVIDEGVVLKRNVILGNNVTINKWVLLGRNVHIYENSIIGAITTIYKFSDVERDCQIGARNIILDHSTIEDGTITGDDVNIGNNCLICKSKIADRVTIENDVGIGEGADIRSGAYIEEYAYLKENVTILEDTMISLGALIRENAMIGRDDFGIVIISNTEGFIYPVSCCYYDRNIQDHIIALNGKLHTLKEWMEIKLSDKEEWIYLMLLNSFEVFKADKTKREKKML